MQGHCLPVGEYLGVYGRVVIVSAGACRRAVCYQLVGYILQRGIES
jgi:hypothetical protein